VNTLSFVLLMTGVLLNAFAQTLLKAGTNQLGDAHFTMANAFGLALRTLTMWPFVLAYACYGVSLVVWVVVLSRVPVTIAYPMVSLGYIVNALIARFWLGETLSFTGWSGIAVICFGVWLIARHG